MTTQPPRSFTRVAIAIVVAGLVIGAGILASSYLGTTKTVTDTSTSTTTVTRYVSVSVYPGGQAYLNVPQVYSDLGYPKLTYESYSPYLPSKPNFTLEFDYQTASVGGDAMSLAQAIGVAAQAGNLSPANYSLAEADFEPGVIVNNTLAGHPEWLLFFARTYAGYWPYGGVGNSAVSLEFNVDAFNGTVYPSGNISPDGAFPYTSAPLPTPASLKVSINSSSAVAAIRESNLSGVPRALSANGTVTFMEPRIVFFGPTSNNEAFTDPVNASLSGQYALCWVVSLYSLTPGFGYQGTFAVDAGTGQLVSGSAGELFPNTPSYTVAGSVDYPSANGLAVSQEVFQISGSPIAAPGTLPVTVPDVLIAKPGSTGSIELNFSSTLAQNLSATLSLVNPLPKLESLPNGLPAGISIQFTPKAFAVPALVSVDTQLTISVSQNAPAGTYLLDINATLYNSDGTQWGGSGVVFLLSVWDGSGQWPPPPT